MAVFWWDIIADLKVDVVVVCVIVFDHRAMSFIWLY